MSGRIGGAAPSAQSERESERRNHRLIVVCGLGGSGKTTIADAVSRHLNIACLHKDSIKAAVFDGLGILTPKSFQVFQTLVEEQLANGVDLIVDATFQFPDSADVLRRWQSTYGLDLVCIICRADTAERERRIRTRTRHEAHAEADTQQLAALGSDVDYSTLPGRHIAVDTQGPASAVLTEVARRLRGDS